MAKTTINARLILRNGTSTEWQEKNPLLLEGEIGVENNTGLMKLGDGVTLYNDLPYTNTPPVQVTEIINGVLTDYIPKPSNMPAGNIPIFSSNGVLVDSGIHIEGENIVPNVATETVIGGVLSSPQLNSVSVLTDGTMIINGISTSKLFNDPNDELILVAGQA